MQISFIHPSHRKTIVSEPLDRHFGKVFEISCYLQMKTEHFLNFERYRLRVNEERSGVICLRDSTV